MSAPPTEPAPNEAPRPRKTTLSMVRGPRAPRPAVDTSQPLRPAWAEDRSAFKSAIGRKIRAGRYHVACFLRDLPGILWYLGILYPWIGLARVVRALSKYLYDYDSAQVRHAHASNMETKEYLGAQRERRSILKARWMVATAIAVAVAGPALAWTAPVVLASIAAPVLFVWVVKLIPGKSVWEFVVAAILAAGLWWWLPTWLAGLPQPPLWPVIGLAVAAWLAFGWYGRPADGKLRSDRYDMPSALVKPSAELVTDALVASVPGITEKNRDQVRVHAPGVARARHGYHLSLELPPGSTVSDVMEKREPFAAALRRQLGCVWPSGGHMHPGHLRLYIGDEPMATAPQARWKLAEGKQIDVFDALELFTDQEGRWVELSLMYKALVIGGAPGFGKSFALRELGGGVALDPRTRITVLDGKANGDMRPFRLVAHGYFEDDDDEGIAAQVKAIQEIRQEMRRRAKFLRELPAEENPEDKVTSALVDKYPHLAPWFVLVDEVQVYTEHEDKKVREAFIAAAADLVRRGRSAGIVPIFCTQKPSAEVLPTAIVDNCSVRLCFKVNGQRANDAVLGNEMHSSGIKATKFGPDDKSLAWLKGDGAEPIVVRTVYGLDKPASESLLAKARALRERLGKLTGYAAGEEAEREELQVSLLEDLRDVMDHPQVPTMLLDELRESLADLRPQTWGHLDNAALGSMLREAGVRVGTVWSRSTKKDGKGVKREWLDVAATSDEDPDEDDGGVVVNLTR